MDNPIVIFGAGSVGLTAFEICRQNHIVVYGFLDDNLEKGSMIEDVSVLGKLDDRSILKLIDKKCDAFVALDENSLRKKIVDILIEDRKVMPINAISADARISDLAIIGHGNLIGSFSYLGPKATVGNHCIVHESVMIQPSCEISDLVQIGAGSIINANVKIDKKAFIGSGCTIVSGVTIGAGARVGAGSVVIESVKKGATVFGNPAKSIK